MNKGYVCYLHGSTKNSQMILFENSTVKLEYDPTTDIAVVEYPDLHGYLLSEIKFSIDILVETVRNYDVKKLLLDSTRTVSTVSEEQSREVATYLAIGLTKTRLEKVARVQSPAEAVETRAQHNIRQIRESQHLPFLLENFTSKSVAMEWLTGKERG